MISVIWLSNDRHINHDIEMSIERIDFFILMGIAAVAKRIHFVRWPLKAAQHCFIIFIFEKNKYWFSKFQEIRCEFHMRFIFPSIYWKWLHNTNKWVLSPVSRTKLYVFFLLLSFENGYCGDKRRKNPTGNDRKLNFGAAKIKNLYLHFDSIHFNFHRDILGIALMMVISSVFHCRSLNQINICECHVLKSSIAGNGFLWHLMREKER